MPGHFINNQEEGTSARIQSPGTFYAAADRQVYASEDAHLNKQVCSTPIPPDSYGGPSGLGVSQDYYARGCHPEGGNASEHRYVSLTASAVAREQIS